MDEHEEHEDEQKKPQQRVVRIIGAEEAAAALETGEASGRRPVDEPRPGDVPPAPSGPRPAHRFPLPSSVNPAEARPIGRQAQTGPHTPAAPDEVTSVLHVARDHVTKDREDDVGTTSWEGVEAGDPADHSRAGYSPADHSRAEESLLSEESSGDHEMQHWTEPPTGEVPRIFATGYRPEEPEEGDDDFSDWASLPGHRAAWRDHETDWDDESYEPSMLADDETRLGALDDSRPEHLDEFGFELGERVGQRYRADAVDATEHGQGQDQSGDVSYEGPTQAVRQRRDVQRSRSRRDGAQQAGRNLPVAVLTGVGSGIAAVVLFELGTVTSLLLSLVVVTLATAEAYAALRRAGYQPATLLGIAAAASLMIAVYLKGEAAVPLVLALTIVFTLLWYLVRVAPARPAVNAAATLLVFSWVGVLGSFAGLMLDPRAFPNRHGIAFLVGAVLATIAYDVGGYVFGGMGKSPLAPDTSPNKTWLGLAGGMVTCFAVSVVIMGNFHPWTIPKAAALGLVVAVVAPLGDLCESMIKRDLKVKDMGSLLPGHGGVLDRVDAMLFALPAVYYLIRLVHL